MPSRSTRRWRLCNTIINGVFPHWWTVNEELSSLAAWNRLRATGEDLKEGSAVSRFYSFHLQQIEQARILPNTNEHFKLSTMSKAAGSTSGCLDILNVKSSKCCVSLLRSFAGSWSLSGAMRPECKKSFHGFQDEINHQWMFDINKLVSHITVSPI